MLNKACYLMLYYDDDDDDDDDDVNNDINEDYFSCRGS